MKAPRSAHISPMCCRRHGAVPGTVDRGGSAGLDRDQAPRDFFCRTRAVAMIENFAIDHHRRLRPSAISTAGKVELRLVRLDLLRDKHLGRHRRCDGLGDADELHGLEDIHGLERRQFDTSPCHTWRAVIATKPHHPYFRGRARCACPAVAEPMRLAAKVGLGWSASGSTRVWVNRWPFSVPASGLRASHHHGRFAADAGIGARWGVHVPPTVSPLQHHGAGARQPWDDC